MRDPKTASYAPPYDIDSVIANLGVGEVVSTSSPDYKKGDIVWGFLGTEQYSKLSANTLPTPPTRSSRTLTISRSPTSPVSWVCPA